MAYDAEFFDGFDKYGPIGGAYITYGGFATLLSMLLAGEWTSYLEFGDTPGLTITVAPALSGPAAGKALSIVNTGGGFGGEMYLAKTLDGSYARVIGGSKVQVSGAFAGYCIANIGEVQVTVYQLSTGQFAVNRGLIGGGTRLGVTAESRPLGAIFELEWDITVAPGTGGAVTLWLDGAVTSIQLTGVNTSADGNSVFNQSGVGGNTGGGATWDHFYEHLYVSPTTSDTPLLTGAIVETTFPLTDQSIQFTPEVSVIGAPYVLAGNNPVPSSTPGANTIFLRQFTPPVNMTLQSIAMLPAQTSSIAKFTPGLYADNAGTPDALIESGPQVIGCTAGMPLIAPLSSGTVLTGGTPYWIGFDGDTNIAFYLNINEPLTNSAKAANTYTGGLPNPAPTMTYDQVDWAIWGACTNSAANYVNVDENPAPVPAAVGLTGGNAFGYNQSATVGQTDLFGFGALAGSPTYIYSSAIKALAAVPTGGSRDLNCVMQSSGTDGTGSVTDLPLGGSFLWQASYFDDDPHTSAPWAANIAALNAAYGGYSIAA